MKTVTCALLTLLSCGAAMANSNFVSNPYLPYPPACAQAPEMDAQGRLKAPAVNFFAGQVTAIDTSQGLWVPIMMRAYRSPCSEPNRSIVWLTFALDPKDMEEDSELLLPSIFVRKPGVDWSTWVFLASEPNGWNSGAGADTDREARYLTVRQNERISYFDPLSPNGKRRWRFVLDNYPPLSEWWPWADMLTPSEYNGRFDLVVGHGPDYTELTINVPATSELFGESTNQLPLSGRLSGNWVIEGAADQGIMLSISGKIPSSRTNVPEGDDLSMVVFLAHYTFDAGGNMLWLTGAAEIEQGATEVSIPIENVTGGEFRGTREAQRQVIGHVTITSRSCNDLEFDYDYSGLSLGSGSKHLQRLYSLETAGYDCRDHEAKVAANR